MAKRRARARKVNQWVLVSGYLFLLGIIVSVVAGILPGVIPAVGLILLILGTIIGLLGALGVGSIGREEILMFLLATVALVAAGNAGAALVGIPGIGAYLNEIVNNISALVIPAAVIMALKVIWQSGSIEYKM